MLRIFQQWLQLRIQPSSRSSMDEAKPGDRRQKWNEYPSLKGWSQFKGLSLVRSIKGRYLGLPTLSVSAGIWDVKGRGAANEIVPGTPLTGVWGWWHMGFLFKYIHFFSSWLKPQVFEILPKERNLRPVECQLWKLNGHHVTYQMPLWKINIWCWADLLFTLTFWDDRQSLSKTTARGRALRRLKSRVF